MHGPPLPHLEKTMDRLETIEALIGGPEMTERRKAAEARQKSQLAIETRDEEEDFAKLVKLGFVIKGRVDSVLVDVELPEGWRMERSQGDMRTTNILDGAGNIRGFSWCKGASYDYAGYISLTRRLGVREDFRVAAAPDDIRPQQVVDQRVGYPEIAVIHRFEATGEEVLARKAARAAYRAGTMSYEDYMATAEVAHRRAIAWLAEHYPDYADPRAYWETEFPVLARYREER